VPGDGRRWQHPLGQRTGVVSKAILKWLTESGIETAFIDPGKPWQNGANESFNGKSRDESLGMQWFKNRIDAKVVIEDWRQEYNEIRPHSSLGDLTPLEYARTLSESGHGQAILQEPLVRRSQAGHGSGSDGG
jgi:putative transposase